MTAHPSRPLLVAALAVAVCFAAARDARAADKKAEGELRWGLNYCTKVVKAMDHARARGDLSASTMQNEEDKWKPDYEKFKEYLGKATAIDPGVTASETVYDKKEGTTYARSLERCQKLEAEMAQWSKQIAAKNGAKQEAKAAAAKEETTARTKEAGLEAARAAIEGVCAQFRRWEGSSGFDERQATYDAKKKEALAATPPIAAESLTVSFLGEGAKEPTPATKTVAEWFKACDELIPAHAAKVRQQEKDGAAASEADGAKRKAYNDKLRKEQAEQFRKLVADTGGDRQRTLQSKGFLPWWPRNGDLRTAPVWKWEINITGEVVRCESFQFNGDKLVKNDTALGSCP